ncbi:Pachytene checkpoint protein 2 like protein [Argiope bruennichi]|uniref:Pachytene checkpoint protein 2 like protein n=1 Tax=Argiope bruennichi TaxID=94029 RepID=A0A8T0FBF9_ARGBR|nr:Pachytene checkpoint protein 2 like protein [Argiope bruennichi]
MAESLNSFKIFHIEILLHINSLLKKDDVVARVATWLSSQGIIGKESVITKFDDDLLSEHIKSIKIYENDYKTVNGEYPEVRYYVYSFNSTAPEIEESEDEQQISTQWILPTQEFQNLWDSLIYDSNVKDELINYVGTALDFSDKSVDPTIVSWNRIVLLHGPPGTGKTSLYEVETLARSRSSSLNGNEPSDALRVVNAVLTHLDMIKRYPNVLILTTSNITDAIDVALIDRADIKQYIGLPSIEAIYQIYSTCIKELQQCGIICTRELLLPLHRLRISAENEQHEPRLNESRSLKLRTIAEQSVGLSGRTLRKMPFIACALFIKTKLVSLEVFLDALSKAVEKHWQDVKNLHVHV